MSKKKKINKKNKFKKINRRTRPDLNITTKDNPSVKEVFNLVNTSKYRKTVSISSLNDTPQSKKVFDVSCVYINNKKVSFNIGCLDDYNFLYDVKRCFNFIKLELKVYNEQDIFLASVSLFPTSINTLAEGKYIFNYDVMYIFYDTKLTNIGGM